MGLLVSPAWADAMHETQRLNPAGASASAVFGLALGLDGGLAAVGAPSDDLDGDPVGSVRIFELASGHWSEQASLRPPAGEWITGFGRSLAVSGQAVAVASTGGTSNGASGAAFVYRIGDAGWELSTRLFPTDPDAQHFFARSIDLSGDAVVVGSHRVTGMGTETGLAIVYREGESGWGVEAALEASDGTHSDAFGSAVGISGDLIVVGAPSAIGLNGGEGAAYVFRRDGAAWHEEAKLIASDGGWGDRFGEAVAIDGDVIAIGAPYDDDLASNAGAAYLFHDADGAWMQSAKVYSSNPQADGRFGLSVDIEGGLAIVGTTYGSANGISAGEACVYRLKGTDWLDEAVLHASDGQPYDSLGIVSLSGETALVGAPYADGDEMNIGAAYIFDLGETCVGDLDGSGDVGIDDVLQLIGAFGTADPAADLDGDGVVGIDDLLGVLGVFGQAC